MNYNKSDYAINKYSEDIVYRFADGTFDRVSSKDFQSLEEFIKFKNKSDEMFKYEAIQDAKIREKIIQGVDVEQVNANKEEISEEELWKNELKYLESIKKLNTLLESLTDTQKRRVRLFYFHNLTQRKVAEIEKKSQNAINKSLKVAIEKMKCY